MTLLEVWVQSPVARALGWALVHSLWEGASVALAVALVLSATRAPRLRYAAACVGLFTIVAAFAVTFAIMAPQSAASRAFSLSWMPSSGPGSPSAASFRGAPNWLPWLSPFWALGVLLFSLRGAAAWIAARRLRRTGVCPEHWQLRLAELAVRVRVSRPVALLESGLVAAPAVIGWLRPVILTPVGMLAALPVAQVESILLHELAHIRRLDYLVNVAQAWVEALMFYHPAVWWLSGMIRTERENCCDDLVVDCTGDAREYAAALATLEYRRSTAVAATGGSLMKRIQRILRRTDGPSAGLAPVWMASLLTMAAAAALTAWQTPSPAPPASPIAQFVAEVKHVVRAQAPRIAFLPQVDRPVRTPYERWLNEDVLYIIDDRERATFESLRSNEEREHFIEQFWARRGDREEHYRRIAYANEHYGDGKTPGWKTPRGRIYIIYGPPVEILIRPAPASSVRQSPENSGGPVLVLEIEEWRYPNGAKHSFALTRLRVQ